MIYPCPRHSFLFYPIPSDSILSIFFCPGTSKKKWWLASSEQSKDTTSQGHCRHSWNSTRWGELFNSPCMPNSSQPPKQQQATATEGRWLCLHKIQNLAYIICRHAIAYQDHPVEKNGTECGPYQDYWNVMQKSSANEDCKVVWDLY